MNWPLLFAGREIPNATDLVRRYTGVEWSGGPSEVWAYRYYDEVPTVRDSVVSPVDVVCAAALHPGLSRNDLVFFVERAAELTAWLEVIDPDQYLWAADESLLSHLDALVDFEPDVSLTLLTKVLHRKRPDVIPLLDRHVVDAYRPVTGERRPSAAWPGVVRAIRDDLASPETRLFVALAASAASRPAGSADGRHLSMLRFIDIAIWMAAR